MNQGIKPIIFTHLERGDMLFRARPMWTCLVGAHVEISVGQFSLFFKNHWFLFFMLLCENQVGSWFYLFLIRGLQDPLQIFKIFPRKKIQFWGLAVLSNLIIAGFLDQFSQARFQKLQKKKLEMFFLHYFSWEKNTLNIFFSSL
jgi:hypothetical protein